ncbi:MAG: thioredoxin domain-containing protein [Bacteroidetes bacterium]|nr:MAG: thioredoxin domain-containing protein [Bacteroidota bacterium]
MNNNEAPKYTNSLIKARSPYLLQHAHNPVNWMEWGDEAWAIAKRDDKPVLVSIGYAACHWCHVMERESFENKDTADIMNEFFVCIKVDREERPDVDQLYMDAVQLISGHGGWPLNMFCLPDGRPIHGGTYFPNANWNQLLFQVRDLYINRRSEAEDYAAKLIEGIKSMDILQVQESDKLQAKDLQNIVNNWAKQFDYQFGGMARTPKFPLPNNYHFLLSYAQLSQNAEIKSFVHFTLKKMALGGIYDQLGGGFARYSVDGQWLVPHFEKMLYDNGQLLSLYSKAYSDNQDPLYKTVVEQTIAFIDNKWANGKGAYFASWDADSEGEEGQYYVWSKAELEALWGEQAPLLLDYYRITEKGNWEDGKNILHAHFSNAEYAALRKMPLNQWLHIKADAVNTALASRAKRIEPALDDKVLLSWNALYLEGLCDAYRAFQNPAYLDKALALAEFIEAEMYQDGVYYRVYKQGLSVPAFLEDLASLSLAYTALYQVCFDERYLVKAKVILDDILNRFSDEEAVLFYFTPSEQADLQVRKKDATDDVISSGNAMVCRALHQRYHYFGEPAYKARVEKMLQAIRPQFLKYAPWYSYWGLSFLEEAYGLFQLCSAEAEAFSIEAHLHHSAVLLAKTGSNSQLPLTQERSATDGRIYVCENESCYTPVYSLKEAEALIFKA